MELVTVDNVTTGCTLCHTHDGPFVLTDVASLDVPTPAGIVPMNVQVAFCAPTERRQGCAGQIARAIGYSSPDELENLRAAAADALEHARTVEAELEEQRGKMVSVVAVDDLLELIGEKKGKPRGANA